MESCRICAVAILTSKDHKWLHDVDSSSNNDSFAFHSFSQISMSIVYINKTMENAYINYYKFLPAWHQLREQADRSLYWRILISPQHDEQFPKKVLAKNYSYQCTLTTSSAILSHWSRREKEKKSQSHQELLISESSFDVDLSQEVST